jgi:hypothetical protein
MNCDFKTNDDLRKQFIEVLVAIKVDSGTSGAMSKLFVMARAMSRKFSGIDLHRFTTSILQDSGISDNHLYTAKQLGQFALRPGVILGSFAKHQTNWTPVYKYLSCWSKTQVLEGLEAVIGLFDKSMLPIQEEMLQFSWVPPDYFEGVLSHVPPKLTADIDVINLLTIRTK